jgi:hypothetical protein
MRKSQDASSGWGHQPADYVAQLAEMCEGAIPV